MKIYKKLKKQVWKTKIDKEYKIFMVFHAHINIIHSVVHKSLLFGIEEKLVALLVYSSFSWVATSDFQIIP